MEEEVDEGLPAWMGTFADLMSLLLCFFVLLLSFASVDVMKFEGMIGSMRDAFGVHFDDPGMHVAMKDSMLTVHERQRIATLEKTVMESLEGRLKKMTERMQVAGSVEIQSGRHGVVIRVDGDLIFRPGSSEIHPQSMVFLDEMAAVLRQFPYNITVEGHADKSAPTRASFPTNFHLSSARALSTLTYLIDAGGIPPQRMSATGYGDTRPIVPNTTKKNRSKNRRVEFVVHRMDATRPDTPRTVQPSAAGKARR